MAVRLRRRLAALALLGSTVLMTSSCDVTVPTIRLVAGTIGLPSLGAPLDVGGVAVADDDWVALAESEAYLSPQLVWTLHLPTGVVGPAAGTGHVGGYGDGGPATDAHLFTPAGMEYDSGGNLYIAELEGNRVRRVDAGDGTISTVAGYPMTGADWASPDWALDPYGQVPHFSGFAGDGGPATDALLSGPIDVAIDAADNLYIADTYNLRVRRVSAATGDIETVVGGGTNVPTDGEAGGDIALQPRGIAIEPSGGLLITTAFGGQLLRWDPDTDTITVVAGNGGAPGIGDGGPALDASFYYEDTASSPPDHHMHGGIDVAPDGTIYIADTGHGRVRAISGGIVNTVAGGGTGGPGGPGTDVALYAPLDVEVTPGGRVVITDGPQAYVLETDGTLTQVGGIPHGDATSPGKLVPETGAAANAAYAETGPSSVAVDPDGSVISSGWTLVRIAPDGTLGPPVGAPSGAPYFSLSSSGGGTVWTAGGGSVMTSVEEWDVATGAKLRTLPFDGRDVAMLPGATALYVSTEDAGAPVVRNYDTDADSSTVAAGGGALAPADGVAATDAAFDSIGALGVDPSTGDLLLIDRDKATLWRVDAITGLLTQLAGTGTDEHTGDGGPATAAGLWRPADIAVDNQGVIYVLELHDGLLFVGGQNGGQVRRIDTDGTISTHVGDGSPSGRPEDGDEAATTSLGNVTAIAVSPLTDELYLADSGARAIYRVQEPPPASP